MVPDPGEGSGHVGLEVVPPEAELLRGTHVAVGGPSGLEMEEMRADLSNAPLSLSSNMADSVVRGIAVRSLPLGGRAAAGRMRKASTLLYLCTWETGSATTPRPSGGAKEAKTQTQKKFIR